MSADKHSPADANPLAMAVLNAVQNPVILVDAEGFIAFANWEAEAFRGQRLPSRPLPRLHLHSLRQSAACADRSGAGTPRAGK